MQKQRKLSVLIFIIGLSLSSKLNLINRISLPFTFEIYNNNAYGTLELLFGTASSNSTSKGQQVKVIPDFSESQIFIGNKENLNWGVNCDASHRCTPVGDMTTCKRKIDPSLIAQCQKANTILRMADQDIPDGLQEIEINILQNQDSWFPRGVGIVGVAPNSPFWEYINNAYDNGKAYIDVSFFYRANDVDNLKDITEENYKNALFTINGDAIADQHGVPHFVDVNVEGRSYWMLDDVDYNMGGKSDKNVASKLCISNTINSTLALSNLAEFKDNFMKQLCGKSDNCERINSNINSVDPFKITIYNETDRKTSTSVSIGPEELFYFDSDGKVQLLVKDINTMKEQFSNLCGTEASFAMGLMAFGKREISIRYFNKDRMQIAIVDFEPTYVYLIILLVLASILLALFLVACLYTISMRLKDGKLDQVEEGSNKVPLITEVDSAPNANSALVK